MSGLSAAGNIAVKIALPRDFTGRVENGSQPACQAENVTIKTDLAPDKRFLQAGSLRQARESGMSRSNKIGENTFASR